MPKNAKYWFADNCMRIFARIRLRLALQWPALPLCGRIFGPMKRVAGTLFRRICNSVITSPLMVSPSNPATPIRLSYYITTFQKFSYLKIALQDLIDNRKGDEEIVVADGGSKDGSAEWLAELLAAGKIQQFISAPDRGEAHGVNRAMLACRGELLRWINDDDVFCYPAIAECKAFMLANPEYDVLGADGFDNYTGQSLELVTHVAHFQKWQKEKEPFGFYGPGLMLRRATMELVGVTNALSRFVDNESAWMKGPFFQAGLPFRQGPKGKRFFDNFETQNPSYAHQEAAWRRLDSDVELRAIVFTKESDSDNSGHGHCNRRDEAER